MSTRLVKHQISMGTLAADFVAKLGPNTCWFKVGIPSCQHAVPLQITNSRADSVDRVAGNPP